MNVLRSMYDLLSNPVTGTDVARANAAANILAHRIYVASKPQDADRIAIVINLESGTPAPALRHTPHCQTSVIEIEVWAKANTDREATAIAAELMTDIGTLLIQYSGTHQGIAVVDVFPDDVTRQRAESPRDQSDDWTTVFSSTYAVVHTMQYGDKVRI